MQFVAQNFILNEYKEKNLFLGESSEMLFVWCDVFRNLYTKIRLISPLDELNECLDESYLSTIKIYNLTHNFDKPRLIEILRNSQLTKNKANDIYTWEIIDPSLCP
jgi:hypothetical protein